MRPKRERTAKTKYLYSKHTMTFSVGFAAFAKAHKRNSSILNFNAS